MKTGGLLFNLAVAMQVKPGDYVLLLSKDQKTYMIKVTEDGTFGTHMGNLEHNEMIGRGYGEVVNTHMGKPFVILEPTISDRMMKVRRKTQIIYPKDAGFIVLKTGIRPGMRIIECGSGSGAFTIALANAVSPSGKVFAYDRREDFLEICGKNVEENGLADYVEFKVGVAGGGFEETDVDVVILDLPSPWDGVHASYDALRGGGRIASLSPTYNQVEKTVVSMAEEGFVYIETVELLIRRIMARPGKTRPADRMIGHTGFLTFARKAMIEGDEGFSGI
ncbi:MAG: tRNA (adenine-N1)-methyltransferase [Thermodesulfobacteriota bacterium]